MQTSKIQINTGDRLTIITEHAVIICTVTSVRDRNGLPNNPATTTPTTNVEASTTYIVPTALAGFTDKQITTEIKHVVHR